MGAGNGRRSINNNLDSSDFINKMPDDQYVCTQCENVPEIVKLDFNECTIEIKCKDHINIGPISVKEYLNEQLKNTYFNYICSNDKTLQRDSKEPFHYCFECFKKYCKNCLIKDDKKHNNFNKFIVNDISSICPNHYKYYIKYCNICNLQLCQNNCPQNKAHSLIKIKPPENNEIEYLKNELDSLNKKIENLKYLKKLLEIIITTQEKHKYNYFHNINISNIVKNIKESKIKDINKEKLKNIENKLLEYLNCKFQLKLKGDEKELNLSSIDIPPNEFKLFSLINFPNLESINIRDNHLSDINILNNFNLRQIKIIDLSYNEIKNLDSLKDLALKAVNLERLFLNNNSIKKADILKKKIFQNIKEIQIGENNLSEKDFTEIMEKIKTKYIEKFIINYKINEKEFINNKIRIFGDIFVDNNKKNCKLIIHEKETELTNFYNYEEGEKDLVVTFIKTGNINDMSYMFYRCNSLNSLDGISNFDMSNVENISYMFYDCKYLEKLDDISKWETSNLKYMQKMFCNCLSLSKLPPIEKWDIENVKNREGMFDGCKTIIIPDKFEE